MINEIKSQKLHQSNTDTFVTGGTLGDMYIVLCKVYDHHRKTGKQVRLIRYSCSTELDGAINQLFKFAPYVELSSCRKTNSNAESIEKILEATKTFPYLNQKYSGRPVSEQFSSIADPDYITMEPFPSFDIPSLELEGEKFNIGIQLSCGSLGRNFRAFTLKWIIKLSKKIKNLRTKIYILGTGDGYEQKELKQLDRISNIQNWVGKTSFSEWLSLMKSMDVFISLEGFPAFFAMSQKVPTILYDQYVYGIDNAIHPVWRDNGAVIKIGSNKVLKKIRYWKMKYLKRKNLYSPRNLSFVVNFIEKNMLGRDS